MSNKKNGIVGAAMNYAIPLGLFWIFRYLFVILGDYSELSKFVVTVLTIFTPIILYIILCRYRDTDKEGDIDYGDCVLFSLLLFFFATVLETFVMVLHFYIINPQTMMLVNSEKAMMAAFELVASYQNTNLEALEQTKEMMTNVPRLLMISNLFSNIFTGLIFGSILGYFVSKNKSNQQKNM